MCCDYICKRLVKFEESNDKSQLIFGSLTILQAKDAVPLEVTVFVNTNIKIFQSVITISNENTKCVVESQHGVSIGHKRSPADL